MWEAGFAALRILLWFILLFGLLGPVFLNYAKKLPGIDKLIYSWVGMGGSIIFSVFVLTVLHMYDFISLVLTLLLIPLIRTLWKSDVSLRDYFWHFEKETVIHQVKTIENFNLDYWKSKWTATWQGLSIQPSETFWVLLIALAGGITRIYSALQYAAPYNRNWFIELNKVKNLHLQNYFSGEAEPAGMHSLVSVFSILTQISPELILHILGGLISFFLCVIIYWSVRDITKNEYPMACYFAAALYALTPMLFMPLSLNLQIEASSLELALCFAIPTLTFFVRNLRGRHKCPWFYVMAGFFATGMTNLFVLVIILLPLMTVGTLSLPRRRYFRSLTKVLTYILIMSALIGIPIVIFNWLNDVGQFQFFLNQMFSTKVYGYYPILIAPLSVLSEIYLAIAGMLFLGYSIEYVSNNDASVRDEITFLLVFGVVAIFYLPYFSSFSSWIDTDQLAKFYSILIAFLGGVLFSTLLRWAAMLFKPRQSVIKISSIMLFLLAIAGAVYLQGGIRLSRQLPSTVPDGFYSAYYSIIDDYLPYSYATVGPPITEINAKNRHYFMDYGYFLDTYGKIDSTYHRQLNTSALAEKPREVPPASIFVFVEKPPYNAIQKGILPHPSATMRDINQWISAYRTLPDRMVSVYYEDKNTKVYQIINRPDESKITDELGHTNPQEATHE